MRDMTPVLICFVIFSTIGWVVYVLADAYRRKQRLKVISDLHTRVLDRMGSTTEFGAFLQTEGGRQFLDSLTMERTHPAEKVARAMQTGIVLTAVGIGLIMVRPVVDLEAEGGFTVLSALILSLGVGFLLSAVASWMLGRTFGLFTKSLPLEPKPPTFTDSSSLGR